PARCRSPHGRPSSRLGRHGVHGPFAGRPRRRDVVSREAPATLHHEDQHRHSPVLPLRRRPPILALSGTLLLCLVILGNTFLVGAFGPVLPEIARTRGLADWQLGVVAGALGCARRAGAMPAGLLADRHVAASLVLSPAFLAVGLVCVTTGTTFSLLVLG